MTAVCVGAQDVDLERHDCGRPYAAYTDPHQVASACFGLGFEFYELVNKLFRAGSLYPSLWVCHECDAMTLWAPHLTDSQVDRLAARVEKLEQFATR